MTKIRPGFAPGKPLPVTANRRPQIPSMMLNVLVACFIMAAHNRTFWHHAMNLFGNVPLRLTVFGLAVWSLTLLTIVTFGFRWLQKPVLIFLLIVAAVSSYYQEALGITIDREMIHNAMLTTFNESKHLLTLRFMLHVALWGILPSLVVLWIRVKPVRFLRDLWTWPVKVVLVFALFAGLLFSDFKAISAVIREHHELMGSYQPGASIGATARYAKMMLKAQNVVAAPLGTDARKGPLLAAAQKPVLTVLFAGETARAQNFGLNGYARDTTPELRKRGVINFTDVTSCGTSTAVSLPCMFSVYRQSDYSHQKHVSTENLLDVMMHAGIKVEWLDNNTGDQDIAKRLHPRMMTAEVDPAACAAGECTDQVFMGEIAEVAETMTEDTLLVIHMIGSHGPAYYLRYPPEFEKFSPACKTPEFANCTPEEIANAYDNTIAYTDYILSQTIDMLKGQDRVIPAVLFISDHGESLGEGGLYLHAAPWFMAPDVQTHVPMVFWFSDTFKKALGIDTECLARKGDQPQSHDILFHTVLGLMNIETEVRDPTLDLSADCRVAG